MSLERALRGSRSLDGRVQPQIFKIDVRSPFRSPLQLLLFEKASTSIVVVVRGLSGIKSATIRGRRAHFIIAQTVEAAAVDSPTQIAPENPWAKFSNGCFFPSLELLKLSTYRGRAIVKVVLPQKRSDYFDCLSFFLRWKNVVRR